MPYTQGAVMAYDPTTGVFGPTSTVVLDFPNQNARITATPIVVPLASGIYLVSAYLKVITPATTSVLGGNPGVVITFTDATDNSAQSLTMALQSEAGAPGISNAGNTTATKLVGSALVNSAADQPINIDVGYTSNPLGTMHYEAHFKCVAL